MDRTENIIECIRNNIPVVYCKFGDGEYFCMIRYTNNGPLSKNSDNDKFTEKLSSSLVESYKFISSKPNVYIGQWKGNHKDKISEYYNGFGQEVLWTDYHTLIFEFYDIENTDPEKFIKKIRIYKEIQLSPVKKIYVCNKLLVKAKMLLNIDHFVFVPFNSWFDNEFDRVFNEVSQLLSQYGNCIVLTSCGMSAKVLITELYKVYPNSSYIDIGSGLDLICTKRNSRGFATYKSTYLKFKQFYGLPDEWIDPKYDYVYQEAMQNIGINLPKTEIYKEKSDDIKEIKYSTVYKINSNNCYQYYLEDSLTHNFITKFDNIYSIIFNSNKNGKIKFEYEFENENTIFLNDDNFYQNKINDKVGIIEINVNANTESILKFNSEPDKKIILKNVKFFYGTVKKYKYYENIIYISSKIYVSNKPFTYTDTRSIFSTQTRFEQTIKSIESVRKFIPNSYIILFDNSNFKPSESTQLNSLVDLFINNTTDPIIDYYTNNCENKAYGELCQTFNTLKEIGDIRFKNFFKLSGRYIINDTFDYKIFDSEHNIFKPNPKLNKDFYYTSFYKISWNNFNEYKKVISELFEIVQKDKNLYHNISYEIFFPLKLQFKTVDYLGITEYIAVKNQINYI